jgi:hypothetical protein
MIANADEYQRAQAGPQRRKRPQRWCASSASAQATAPRCSAHAQTDVVTAGAAGPAGMMGRGEVGGVLASRVTREEPNRLRQAVRRVRLVWNVAEKPGRMVRFRRPPR